MKNIKTDYLLSEYWENAKRAYDGISFYPEKRADCTVIDYSEELEDDLNNLRKKGTTGNYKEKYISYFIKWLSSKSRCISPMITGPANFPTARNRKNCRYAENAYSAFREWRKKYFKSVNRVRTLSPEEEIDITLKKLDSLITNQEFMKGVNKIVRKKDLSSDEKINLIENEWGVEQEKAAEILKPDCCGIVGFASYQLTNNNANIKRMKDKLLIMKRRIEIKESFNEIAIPGGYIGIENDRVVIRHEEKPDRAVIDAIKSKGFRWSRNFSSWSRKHTANALYDAKSIFNIS